MKNINLLNSGLVQISRTVPGLRMAHGLRILLMLYQRPAWFISF